MRTMGLAIWTLVVAIGVWGPATADIDDDDRYVVRDLERSWTWKPGRRGPPPWVRARRGRWLDPTTEPVEPDPPPTEFSVVDSEIACADEDEFGLIVGVMLNGALGALSESGFSSPVAQAAAAAAAAAVDARDPSPTGDCFE